MDSTRGSLHGIVAHPGGDAFEDHVVGVRGEGDRVLRLIEDDVFEQQVGGVDSQRPRSLRDDDGVVARIRILLRENHAVTRLGIA